MPTTITSGILAAGQLGASKVTIYGPVDAGKQAHVHIVLGNTSSTTDYTFGIYLKKSGGTSRRYNGNGKVIAAKGNVEIPGHNFGIRLGPGDEVEGDASTAAVIDYTVYGGTEPVPT